ncbi:STAS domain-containing protein [Planococcus sp. CAU13]|uniref:STAS domain-containing protein n=1 Tax=Planococcus sp. CAU13 TaxID=1541197 RepID=UPI00052FE709|nr:STAS domain-containing protein [Planococcus sp. CAU13]
MAPTSPFDGWPLPAFQLNSKLEIIHSSEAAQSMFGNPASFVELLDSGSVAKAEKYLRSSRPAAPVELNFFDLDGEVKLCDFHCKQTGEFPLIAVAVPKDERVMKISRQLADLRKRLNDTNYDLLLEKEETEKLLQRVRQLSAPIIELGDGHLLIPFFGDLDSAKIESISAPILSAAYEKHAEMVILDMTAMDHINEDGMDYLNSLLQTFKVMGTGNIITGVKPEHAKQLHSLKSATDLRFEASLSAVLSERRFVN